MASVEYEGIIRHIRQAVLFGQEHNDPHTHLFTVQAPDGEYYLEDWLERNVGKRVAVQVRTLDDGGD